MRVRDIHAWDAMICGLAMHGQVKEALALFYRMTADRARPNNITFVGLSSACVHGGLVEEGLMLFDSMARDYGIEPEIEHYGCVVDLLGRVGRLREIHELISKMPVEPDQAIILGACRMHNDPDLARFALEKLIELEPKNGGNYVIMSNVHANAGDWGGVAEVRRRLRERGIEKVPGCSSIEIDKRFHECVSGDSSHPQIVEVCEVQHALAKQLKMEGYLPNLDLL
ncbi:pentatricopeptide repeat-containing protein At2g03880, mitochondrial-like [Amborella trichopoda]|uniref:pentatricopeptide repeat-containing protein At2g03880, mitochondrial-like n=1 Tax=Amborella trichopoda TaxID=13333 RepID=UPI0005D3CDE5|nr:pentatricopeptide repeat-containing protein At2g03880, mitochondrial-like [Amborella trichopoda]|eukprot:XP_011627474.1 pentatricopeptide repeat-containing protein At2g03880, mitochondrial-like [Amborella trichopoda]